MKLASKNEGFHQNIVTYISEIIKGLLYILCFVGLAGIAFGIYTTGEHLIGHRNDPLDNVLQTLVVDIITVLALLEVIRTILSYLADGRVRVSLIIDTVMIVTMNEIIKIWFEDENYRNALYMIGVTAILMCLRVLAIRYGPSRAEKSE